MVVKRRINNIVRKGSYGGFMSAKAKDSSGLDNEREVRINSGDESQRARWDVSCERMRKIPYMLTMSSGECGEDIQTGRT